MSNDTHNEICAAGLKLWQVAEGLGTSDSYFSKKLRHEFSDKDKARVRAIITSLTAPTQGGTK
jgi:hypothetical protein